MKRFISIVLILAITLSMSSSLLGCAPKDLGPLTVGVWLSMINQEFGIDSYSEQAPFFPNIQADNPYFGTVQAAAEWGIVDPTWTLNTADKVTWETALLTLVNATGFLPQSATDEEKINYAIEHYDPSIRLYWMNRVIKGSTATALLATAQEQWANKTYDVPVNEVTYADNVKDFSATSDGLLFDVADDGTIVIPASDSIQLKPGDVYLLPIASESGDTTAFRAEDVTTDGEYIYVKNTEEELDIGDVYEELFVQETIHASMNNVTIRDGAGNLISVGEDVVAQNVVVGNSANASNLLNTTGSDTMTVVDLAGGKVSHSFKLDDVEVSFEYQLNGAFDFKVGVEFPNMLSKKFQAAHPSQELLFNVEAGISDLKTTHDIDYGVFKGLKSASIRVDYTTEFEGSLTYKGKPVEKLYAPAVQNYTCKDWQDTFAKNWANSVWKDADGENAKGAKTIKIASVTLKSIGIASLCLDISYEISASGSITVKITERGSKGLEYKNNKLRSIKTCDKDVNVELKGKAESVVAIGPMLYAKGLKKALLGAAVSIGFGVEIGLIMHIADTEGHLLSESNLSNIQGEMAEMFGGSETEVTTQLISEIAASQGCTYESETSGNVKAHFDTCFDGSIYFILRIGLAKNTYAKDLLKSSVKLEWEIFGSKNAKLVHLHACNGDWQFGYIGNDNVQCKLEYTPFTPSEEPTEETTEPTEETNDEVRVSETMMLTEFNASVYEGKQHTLTVASLPAGYSVSDLVWTTGDEKIATVNSKGVVVGVSAGSTIITATTSDGQYNAFCAISVLSEDTATITGLNDLPLVVDGKPQGVII